VLGQRVPNANPFQQNAGYAADALLAPDEETAVELLQNGPDEETRYVVVDYQLGVPGTTKYAAPTAFDSYGLDQGDQDTSNDVSRRIFNASTGQSRFTINTPRAYDSLRVRLYQNNGGAIIPSEGQTFVFDYETTTIDGQLFYVEPQNGPTVRSFPNRSAAREFVEQEGSAQIGGLPGVPSKSVPALEHFRLVHASEQSRFDRNSQRVFPAVKTFERVPGATVEVEGPPNRTVTAAVELETTTRGSTFVYRQRARTNADGVATFTLPYASTGDDEYGLAEGYTNTSVRATGPYEFATRPRTNDETLVTSVYNATGEVTEGQVLGEDDATTTVELERTVIDRPEGANTTGSDSSSAVLPVSATDTDEGGTASALAPPSAGTLAARAG
jgi:dolichyl-diphosphooligosaccharide--protein glycosyltransferase